MKTIKLLSVILFSIAIPSCGGGSSKSTSAPPPAVSLSAVFSDAPVVGLSYSAQPSGITGVTNALGMFTYAPGDIVTFSVAGITLGVASSLPTTSTSGNPSVVTPINLVAGATSASDSTVTAIGQLLGGLNSVAVAVGQGSGGTFTVPSATGLTGANATKVTALLASLQATGATAATLAAAVASGGAAQTAIAAASGTVPTAANAQANITQGINGAALVGSLWSGSCAVCNNGAGGSVSLYFNSDGAVFGFGSISTTGNGRMIGTWQPNASGGAGASFTLVTGTAYSVGPGTPTTLDGSYITGTVSGTAGTAQVYDGTSTAQGSPITLTAAAPAAGTSTTYIGAYKLTFTTLTATGQGTGMVPGTSAIFLAEPNGSTNVAGGNSSVGSFDPATGVGSATVKGNGIATSCGGTLPALTQTISFNLANGTLTNSINGMQSASGTITRMTRAEEVLANFYDNAGTAAEAAPEQAIPLSLNVSIDWPVNTGTATTALDLGIALAGSDLVGTSCNPGPAAQKLEAFGLRPELNPLGAGAAATTTSDTFSVDYIKGQVQTYAVYVLGPAAQYCSVTANGSGSVVDASSGSASLYPTVTVHCTQ